MVKSLLVAALPILLLGGCISTDSDPLALGRGGAPGVAPAALAQAAPPEPAAAMPGQLLPQANAPSRVAGVDPYAALSRADAIQARVSTRAATYEAPPDTPPARRSVSGSALASADPEQPVPAAGLGHMMAMAPGGAPARTAVAQAEAIHSGPTATVEARAAKEQRAQDQRNKRFDSEVRRVTASVCAECGPAPARGRRTRPAPVPDPAEVAPDAE
ncbi:hypothetical protein [Methylobacterium planeticum]|uniref:DUF3035 domain-containing protein n=1 Tax=Methylobacterium planeticum TaxID=2615211 RepID=A0A6N6MSS2_9HYPH|nr:hypothetical protein [Methylobacterium planeticum]KAB1072467.1 hypothetical protein F6X51_15870 [Methylobacterium planeticum]